MCVMQTLSAASEIVSMLGQFQSVRAEKAAGEYNAQQMIQQAKADERNAAYERQEGIENARKERLKAIQNMGNIKSHIAAGNLMTNSSTALNLINDEKINGDLNALDLLNSSEKRAQSYIDSANRKYQSASLTLFKTKKNYIIGNESLLSRGLGLQNLFTRGGM